MKDQAPNPWRAGLGRAAPPLVAACLLAGCQTEPTLVGARTAGDRALRAGEYEDAAHQYERYLEARPGRAEVLYDLGRAYMGMDAPGAAREAFNVAYELEPENPRYIEALAGAMAAAGEAEAAFELLERIALQSQRAEAYTRLGRLLLEQGLADEAVQAMQVAIELLPSAEPYRELAGAYAAFGAEQAELEALRRVLWFDPEDEAAKARVRELGGVPGPTFAAPPAAAP